MTNEVKMCTTSVACILNGKDIDYLDVTSVTETKKKIYVYKLKDETFVLIYLKKI